MPNDSIGVKEKNGKKYIQHKVEKGETLFALSRKYNVHVDKIMDANEGMKPRLKQNQVVLIPFKAETSAEEATSQKQQQPKTHTVQKGETLFSISRKYDASVKEIKKWNNLKTNSISVGQKLKVAASSSATTKTQPEQNNTTGTKKHTVQKGHTLFSISQKYGVSVNELKKWNDIDNASELAVGDNIIVSKPDKKDTGNKTKTDNAEPAKTEKTKKHKIEKGQTLFAISQKYNITIDQIKKWNNINDVNDLAIGDYVYIEKPGNWEELKEEYTSQNNNKPGKDKPSDNVDIVNAKDKPDKQDVKKPPQEFHYTNADVKDKNINEKVVEEGLAEAISEADQYEKDMYLALHPTAPKSTIMRVKNTETEESIFVRVIGKLETPESNNKTIVKLSEKSIERLNGNKQNPFKVEISYIP